MHSNVILTPHPAEMSRLTGKTLNEILDDPVCEAEKAAREWGCVVHLKGATSITAAPDGRISYNLTGNPGLAKGGSGDVLTGIILAMLGQKLNGFDAARTGAYLLGCSADKALRLLGSRMLTASDIIGTLI
jgi:NAD(P)H-hydrate epimerase